MPGSIQKGLTLYTDRRLIAILLLGFVSGFPLALSFSTLSAWLSDVGVSKTSIGLFALLGLPYTLKFLWAPLIDQLPIPGLTNAIGRRRSWLLVTQLCMMVSIFLLGSSDPMGDLWMTAFWALCVATSSATQDMVFDAYRVEMLEDDEQGAGAAMVTTGYMIGMKLAGGTLALFLADAIGWFGSYYVMAGLVTLGMATMMLAGEPHRSTPMKKVKSLAEWSRHAVLDPLQQFMTHSGWWIILLFVLFYKFGDAYAGVMTLPFLKDLGFSNTEIGVYLKTYGLAPTLLGTFLGGLMVHKMPIYRVLLICGLLQMFSNLIFIAQAHVGYDTSFLAVTITVENLASGMGTAAFVAFISRLCSVEYTATQYALLSSISSVGRTVLSSSSGVLVDSVGWVWFFGFSTLFALPGLALLLWLHKRHQSSL